jgi:multiple sugar transport system permease protein
MAKRSLVVLVVLIVLAPFLYMVSVSFMGEGELLRWPPPLWPRSPTMANYAAVLHGALPYGQVLLTTAIFAGCIMVGQVFTSATAGYALARLRFPGREGLLRSLLLLLVLPAIFLVIPRFLLISEAGWDDTYPGLIVTELVSIWGILLMRDAFRVLPRELADAARLDGASEWTLFWRVSLPLVKPTTAAVALLAFVDQWRAFLWPLVITRSADLQVADVALARFHTTYAGNWPYQMAAAVLLTLPVWIICLVGQGALARGVRFTAAPARF